MLNDPIADMLSRIRNATLREHSDVTFDYSKVKESIVKVILEEGFVEDYEVISGKPSDKIKVILKYQKNGQPIIRHIKRISKPGRRVQLGYNKIKPVLNSQGISIVSTSKGVKSDNQCRAERVGGEIICEIF